MPKVPLGRRSGSQSIPMVPADYGPGDTIPDPERVVYLPGTGLVPHIPRDPTLPIQPTASGWAVPEGGRVPGWGIGSRRLIFARLIASGVEGATALRAAWPNTSGGQKNRASKRASKIMANPVMREAVRRIRASLEAERRQETRTMRDFVLARLTHEAQSAPEASARIKALDLLGRSEAMWTTVVRQEQATTQESLDRLKDQLEQRLRLALAKLGVMADRHEEGEERRAGPHPPGTPLVLDGTRPSPEDSKPLTSSPTSREVLPEDLGL